MKYLVIAVLSIFASVSPYAAFAENASSDAEKLAAEKTFLTYFNALTRGDTFTMRSLMTGSLLERRSRLLDNPMYPTHLTETFGNARVSIDQIHRTDSSATSLDVLIILDEENTTRRRFLLRKEDDPQAGTTYQIYDEMAVTSP